MRRAERRRNGIRFCAIQLSIVRAETPIATANSFFESRCLPKISSRDLTSAPVSAVSDLEGFRISRSDAFLFCRSFMPNLGVSTCSRPAGRKALNVQRVAKVRPDFQLLTKAKFDCISFLLHKWFKISRGLRHACRFCVLALIGAGWRHLFRQQVAAS